MTDVTPPAATEPPRLRKWLVPALVASLSLNLLVAGFMLGHAWGFRHRPFGGPPMNGLAGPMGRLIGDLPPDRRALVQGSFDEQRKVLTSLSPAVRAARRDLTGTLRTTPFDRAKLEVALQKLADAEYALRTGTAAVTSQLVEKLTDREREQLERMLRRFSGATDDGREPSVPPKTP